MSAKMPTTRLDYAARPSMRILELEKALASGWGHQLIASLRAPTALGACPPYAPRGSVPRNMPVKGCRFCEEPILVSLNLLSLRNGS